MSNVVDMLVSEYRYTVHYGRTLIGAFIVLVEEAKIRKNETTLSKKEDKILRLAEWLESNTDDKSFCYVAAQLLLANMPDDKQRLSEEPDPEEGPEYPEDDYSDIEEAAVQVMEDTE